jgi:hypothetical protein
MTTAKWTSIQQDLMKRGVCRCGVEMLQVGFFKLLSLQFSSSSSRKYPNQSGSESGLGPHNTTHNLRLEIVYYQSCTCHNKTRGVSQCGLAIYINKYLKAKEELWKLNISPCKNIIFKKSSKRNQNPPRYYNSITNLKFQHKPKYHLSKILIQK